MPIPIFSGISSLFEECFWEPGRQQQNCSIFLFELCCHWAVRQQSVSVQLPQDTVVVFPWSNPLRSQSFLWIKSWKVSSCGFQYYKISSSSFPVVEGIFSIWLSQLQGLNIDESAVCGCFNQKSLEFVLGFNMFVAWFCPRN